MSLSVATLTFRDRAAAGSFWCQLSVRAGDAWLEAALMYVCSYTPTGAVKYALKPGCAVPPAAVRAIRELGLSLGALR